MNKRRRAIAVALCAVVLLFAVVSSAYIAHEAAHPHDCVGKGCPVCRLIARVEQLRRGFGMALPALLLACLALAAGREWRAGAGEDLPAPGTLVGRKIRLND